jgi:hypothetical protein
MLPADAPAAAPTGVALAALASESLWHPRLIGSFAGHVTIISI